MKTLHLLIAVLIISGNVIAQPFLSLGISNTGFATQLGFIHNKIELAASYKLPFTRNDVATIAGISIARQFLLSQNESDNYSIITGIGIASYRIKDFSLYNVNNTGRAPIIQISEIRPLYNIEIGKDSYLGRIFVSGSYCKDFFFGIGIKMFPYR